MLTEVELSHNNIDYISNPQKIIILSKILRTQKSPTTYWIENASELYERKKNQKTIFVFR